MRPYTLLRRPRHAGEIEITRSAIVLFSGPRFRARCQSPQRWSRRGRPQARPRRRRFERWQAHRIDSRAAAFHLFRRTTRAERVVGLPPGELQAHVRPFWCARGDSPRCVVDRARVDGRPTVRDGSDLAGFLAGLLQSHGARAPPDPMADVSPLLIAINLQSDRLLATITKCALIVRRNSWSQTHERRLRRCGSNMWWGAALSTSLWGSSTCLKSACPLLPAASWCCVRVYLRGAPLPTSVGRVPCRRYHLRRLQQINQARMAAVRVNERALIEAESDTARFAERHARMQRHLSYQR